MTAAAHERIRPGSAPVLAVDVHGAARMLGLGRTTVLALADAGELPRLRFGRAVRFAVSDVEHLVERRRSTSQGGRRPGSSAAERAGLFRLWPPDPAELAAQAGRGCCG